MRNPPKTFQEVILFLKSIKIEYVQINSLCILQRGQGSGRDWQDHVEWMKQIYANCVLKVVSAPMLLS